MKILAKILAIDTETEIIQSGQLAPRLVCLTWALDKDSTSLASGLVSHQETSSFIRPFLEGACQGAFKLVGHNMAFDMAVIGQHDPDLIPLIFEAYNQGNIEDTQLREQLLDISSGEFWKMRNKRGGYSLDGICQRRFNQSLDKGEDGYRLRYGELRDTPIDDWPKRAREYAIMDAEVTFLIHAAQGEVVDGARQAKADWALHLMGCWGVITDPTHSEKFFQDIADTMAAHREKLSRTGLLRTDGSKNMMKIRNKVKELLGNRTKYTAKGNIVIGEEVLLSTGDDGLASLVEFQKAQKLDSVWSKHIKQGSNPETPIHARFHCLVESGRTSCSSPNLQNPHRASGLRECFVPRPGYLYAACDYSTLELCTLAQVNTWLFGKANMAEKLKAGIDLHLHFAAQLLDISYEEALTRLSEKDELIKEARQMAKAANFGYPGSMGAWGFKLYAKGYGLDITEQTAKKLRDDWFRTWPEMEGYFEFVRSIVGETEGTIEHFVSQRARGSVRFSQACNSFFQALAADGAKSALFEASRQAYTNPDSPLYGSRPIMFIHDEIIAEVPIGKAAGAAEELSRIMREEMQRFTPDIPIKTSVAIMDRWYKNAEEVRDSNGTLQQWRPEN